MLAKLLEEEEEEAEATAPVDEDEEETGKVLSALAAATDRVPR